MIPIFFGENEKQLFGIYHPHKSQLFRDEGILLCPPAAHEYERTHWAFRQLADLLSKKGFHVFRFDYFATGDSAGETSSGSIPQWEKDIATAANELKDMAGVRNISLVGLRLGAVLGIGSIRAGLKVNKLILWDPVILGNLYLEELKTIHMKKLMDYNRLPESNKIKKNDDWKELIGFPYLPEMVKDISHINLLQTTPLLTENIYLVASEERDMDNELINNLVNSGKQAEYRYVPDVGDWGHFKEFSNTLLPGKILREITAIFA